MEVKKPLRIPRNDQASQCRSFSSSYLPCSQTRKISIGIMVEDPVKSRPVPRKQDEITLPNATSSGRKLNEEYCKAPDSPIVYSRKKQSGAPQQDTSLWLSPKSVPPEIPVTKTDQYFANGTRTLQPEDGMTKMSKNTAEASATKNKDHDYANQTSVLQSQDGARKTFDSVTYERTRKKGGNTEAAKEFNFASAAQEGQVVYKQIEKNTFTKTNSVLRTKLWEILGTASSQNDRSLGSLIPEVVVQKNLKTVENLNQKVDRAAKFKQSSDTIEADSESPDQTTRRPVTRSLTRKKGPKVEQKKRSYKKSNGSKVLPFSNFRPSCQEKNIFTFDEAETRTGVLHGSVDGRSSAFKIKKSSGSSRDTPRKLSFSGKSNQDENQRTNVKYKPPPAAKSTSSLSTREESSHSHPPQTNGSLEELRRTLARTKRNQHEDFTQTQIPTVGSPQEDIYTFYSKKSKDQICNTNSQNYRMEAATPIKNWTPTPPLPKNKLTEPSKNWSPPPPSPKSKSTEKRMHNSEPGEGRSVDVVPISKNFWSSKPRLFRRDEQIENSDDARDLNLSPIEELSPIVEKKVSEDRLSQSSSSEEEYTESLEEDSPTKKGGYKAAKLWSPESIIPEKPSFMFRPSKRLCSPEGIENIEISPTPCSEKCSQETTGLIRASDQDNEDGLARAVGLFALALEKFKTKMELQTSKKSSEILASVSKEIHTQLQNVETRIQTDIRKFTNLGKSKRKRLETRFQEQQQRLNLIRQKLIEDVNQHLQDSKNTVEELESYEKELKGSAEKQKASHKKLLLQVEEAIETQLTDAERRISTIQKVAKGKMFELKNVISECLKDGVFSS